MPNRWVVIPTKAPNESLFDLVNVLIMSGYQPVVVAYAEHAYQLSLRDDFCTVVVKQGESFNSWVNGAWAWLCTLEDAPHVVTMNDDLRVGVGALDAMFAELESGADLVTMSGRGWMHTPAPLTPHLFGVNAAVMRLPDVDGLALWWWNTDHMWHEAVAVGRDIRVVNEVGYVHDSPNGQADGSWRYPSEFAHSVQADHDWWWSQWWHLDPAHSGCYLSFWPGAVPEGQTHRTVWP